MGGCVRVWVWVMLKASVLTALNSVLHVFDANRKREAAAPIQQMGATLNN